MVLLDGTNVLLPDQRPRAVKEPTTVEKRYGHPRFYELLKKMGDVHSAKNHDYAGAHNPLYNFKSVERISMLPSLGIFVRMFDKWSRLENFITSRGELHVKDEVIADTLIDLANYALLMLILMEEEMKGD